MWVHRDHHHPLAAAATRFLSAGVSIENIFRTDRGDDEGGHEWSHERINGHQDRTADGDDIEIVLRLGEDPIVRYVSSSP
jgi:hypothetical protein